jgi:hypothetical protein
MTKTEKVTKTLVEKALEAKVAIGGKAPDAELLDLALAYSQRMVTGAQARIALGSKSKANPSVRLSGILMTAIRQGLLKVERV